MTRWTHSPGTRTPRAARGGALLRVLLVVILLAVLATAAWATMTYRAFTQIPLTVGPAGQTVEVPRGTSFKGVVRQLCEAGVTSADPLLWRALALRMGVTNRLHAGEYALTPGMLPRVLLEDMAAGKVVHRRVTLVDGWTFAQVRGALDKAARLEHELGPLDPAAVMAKLGEPGRSPEGMFMPDTYDYVLGMSDLDILVRAREAMRTFLAGAWTARDPAIPLQTPYQALILASLVEKETAAVDERPRIAGVFERRLKLGMKLDTDPSVIYGMGAAYKGNIRKVDLQTDTPYNTYMRAGLPPTPIALAGRAAILAVLHPAAGDALYFVAKGNGTHQFSATLSQHNAAVRKYILGKHR